jgi:amino acid transporter
LLAIQNDTVGNDRLGEIANEHFITAPVVIFQESGIGIFAVKLLVLISVVGQFFCGLAAITANSRMIYAFCRDGGLPGSRLWHRINPTTRTPTNAVWLGFIALLSVSPLFPSGAGGPVMRSTRRISPDR